MERLKDLLKIEGKGIIELAAYLNTASTMIYKWINDETKPNVAHLIFIADFYNITIDYLLERTEDNSVAHTREIVPFDQQIAAILKRKGISVYKLFKECGFTDGHRYAWFKLKKQPRFDNILKMAEYLNTTVDDIVGRIL